MGKYEEFQARMWKQSPKVYFTKAGKALGTALDYSGEYYDSELIPGLPYSKTIKGKTLSQLMLRVKRK